MAGYELEVEAQLVQEEYRNRLAGLVNYTKTAGGKMEQALRIEADIVDNASKTIKKLQAQKITDKRFDVEADTARTRAEIEALVGSIEAQRPDIQVGADTTRARAEVAVLKSKIDGGSGALGSMVIASRGLEQVASRLGTIGIVAGSVGLGLATVTTGLLAVAGTVFGSSIQNARIGLEALLGDSSQANELLKKLKKAADADPFTLDQYVNTAKQFAQLSKDTDTIVANTRLVAALTAQSGDPSNYNTISLALTQVGFKGKLAAEEVRQFVNAGVGIRQLIPGLKDTTDGLVRVDESGKEVAITFDYVKKALENSLDPQLLEKTAQGISGRLSVLKSSFQNLVGTFAGVDLTNDLGLIKAGSFMDALQKSVSKLAVTFDSPAFQKPLVEAGAGLGEALSGLIDALPQIIVLFGQFLVISVKITAELIKLSVAFLQAFGPQIQQAMKFASDNAEKIAKVFGGLIAGGVLLKVAGGILAVVTPLINFFVGIGGFVGPILASLGGISGILASIGSAFGTLTAGIGLATGSLSGLGYVAGLAFAAITGPIGITVAAITAVVIAVSKVDGAFDSLKNSAVKIFNQLKPLFSGIASFIKDVFSGIITALKPFGVAIINIFKFIADSGIIKIISKVLGKIFEIVGKIVKAIGSFIGLLGKIPGFDKITGSGDKAAEATEKVTKKTKELTEAQKEQARAAQQAFEERKKQYESLVPSTTSPFSNITAQTTAAGLSKITTDNINKIKGQMDNIQSVLNSGGTKLVSYAATLGGEVGNNLINAFARLPEDQRAVAIAQFSKDYESLLKAEADARKRLDGQAYQDQLAENKAQQKRINEAKEVVNNANEKLRQAKIKALVDSKNGVSGLLTRAVAEGEVSKKAPLSKETLQKLLVGYTDKELDAALKAFGVVAPKIDEVTKSAVDAAKRLIKGGTGGSAPDAAKQTAKATAKSTEDVFSAEFAKIDLGKGLEKVFKEFKQTFSNKLKINDQIKARTDQFASEVRAAIDDSLLKHLTFGNPLAALTTAITTAFTTAGVEVARFRAFLGNSVSGVVGVSAAMGAAFRPVSAGATTWFNAAGGSVVKFLAFYQNLNGQIYSASFKIGQAIAQGIANGLNGSLGSALGDTIYRTLANAYNRIAIQVEAAITIMRIRLLAAGIFGGTNITIPQITFPRLASGTNNFEGGIATVGERGPENVILPRGSQVIPAHKSKQQVSNHTENNYITVQGISYEDAMTRMATQKRAKRVMAGL